MSIEDTRIYPINTGWVQADLGTYMFFKGPGGQKIEIPVICYLVDTGDHKIMVDTGMPDAERATRYHHDARKGDCLDSPEAVRQARRQPGRCGHLHLYAPALGSHPLHEALQERALHRPCHRNPLGL